MIRIHFWVNPFGGDAKLYFWRLAD